MEPQTLLEPAPAAAPTVEMAVAVVTPRQESRGQSQMDLLAAVSVKYPCQHQGCIKWALLSTNGERKYCITHMKEYGLAPWRKGCQHPECTKRAQTAITGEVLFCKVHMRLYGLLPKQKMCAHSGCTRVASASQDGKYLYCKTHMKEYGMQPKKDKKVCAHEGCTKIAAATVDGEYKYCKSHMKEYGLQKRKYVKYCRHPECQKRAKRSSCGQWVYCRGHMRLYGMIPEGCKNTPTLLAGPNAVPQLEAAPQVLNHTMPGQDLKHYADGPNGTEEQLLYAGTHTGLLMGDDPVTMQRLAIHGLPRTQVPTSQAAQLVQALQLPLPPLRVEHPPVVGSVSMSLPLQLSQFMPGLASEPPSHDLQAQLQELQAAAAAAVGVPHLQQDVNVPYGIHLKTEDTDVTLQTLQNLQSLQNLTDEEAMAQVVQAVQAVQAAMPNGGLDGNGIPVSMPLAPVSQLSVPPEMQLAAAMEVVMAQHHQQAQQQDAHQQPTQQQEHLAQQQQQQDLVQSMVEDPAITAAAEAAAAVAAHAGGSSGVGAVGGLPVSSYSMESASSTTPPVDMRSGAVVGTAAGEMPGTSAQVHHTNPAHMQQHAHSIPASMADQEIHTSLMVDSMLRHPPPPLEHHYQQQPDLQLPQSQLQQSSQPPQARRVVQPPAQQAQQQQQQQQAALADGHDGNSQHFESHHGHAALGEETSRKRDRPGECAAANGDLTDERQPVEGLIDGAGQNGSDLSQPLKKRRSMYASSSGGEAVATELSLHAGDTDGSNNPAVHAVMQAAQVAAQAAFEHAGGENGEGGDDWLSTTAAAAAVAAAAYGLQPPQDDHGNPVPIGSFGTLDLQQLQATMAQMQARLHTPEDAGTAEIAQPLEANVEGGGGSREGEEQVYEAATAIAAAAAAVQHQKDGQAGDAMGTGYGGNEVMQQLLSWINTMSDQRMS